MDAVEIKNIIINDISVVKKILEDLGMTNIQQHSNYFTFGLPDGDNPSSTTLYLDNLGVKAYTREGENITDIIGLVQYAQTANRTVASPNFGTALKFLYEELGIASNTFDNKQNRLWKSPFEQLRSELDNINKQFESSAGQQTDTLLPRLHENTLLAYLPWDNTEFYNDNISYPTQAEFELGIDIFSHRITIPIRDELGRLVGIKGRRVWDIVNQYNPKYIYLHSCDKNKILFGLDKTLPYIREKDEIIICESEKGVMQLWSYGVKNAVAIGGHSISKVQLEKIIRINVNNIVIAFDKDITVKELTQDYKKICDFANVMCIIDIYNTLEEKESPMDSKEKWENLYRNRRYKINVEKGEIIK